LHQHFWQVEEWLCNKPQAETNADWFCVEEFLEMDAHMKTSKSHDIKLLIFICAPDYTKKLNT
jgi:hypothetical protein